MAKRIITEADVVQAHEKGVSIDAPPGACIVTPRARDMAVELGVALVQGDASQASAPSPTAASVRSSSGYSPGPSPVPDKEELVEQVVAMIRAKAPFGLDVSKLSGIARQAVESRLRAAPSSQASRADASATPADSPSDGARFIEADRLMPDNAAPAPVPGSVIVAEALGKGDGASMSGGYMQWEKASFTRTLECEEVCVIIEGALHLTVGGKTMVGKPGDMIHLSKGARAQYSAPDKVKLACVNCIE